MSIIVDIPVEDIVERLEDYNQIKLYRDTTATGSFSTEVTGSPITLVEDTRLYSLEDTSGSTANWYRYKFYHSTSLTSSDYSAPWQPIGTTAAVIRKEAARRGGLGFANTCSATGATTYLVDTALRDVGFDTGFLQGSWLYRPDAADSGDKLRRVTAFTLASGRLTPSRDWTNAPSSGERYEIYFLYPPYDVPGVSYSWLRAVQDGIDNCWVDDQVFIGEGDGETKRFSLSRHFGYINPENIGGVWLRTYDADDNVISPDLDLTKRGMFVNYIKNGIDDYLLELQFAPAVSQYIFVDCQRRFQQVYADTSVTDGPLKLLALATVWQLYKMANFLQDGKYSTALEQASLDFIFEHSQYNRGTIVV